MMLIDEPEGYDGREKFCPPDTPFDPRTRLRDANLSRAIRAVCTDWPPSQDLPTTDPDD